MNLAHLYEFCTVRQLEIVKAIETAGSQRGAARALGLVKSNVDAAFSSVKRKAANRGVSPEHGWNHAVPEGHTIKRISTAFAQDGSKPIQWVISEPDKQKQAEMIAEAVEAMKEEIPRSKPSALPKSTLGHLCNVYTLTDCHVGMLAWHKEGGADWDLSIAERTLIGCFEQMVVSSPAAKTAFIAQLGDFLHYDSAVAAITPMHGHNLDADGRMPKMVKTAIRILRRVVDVALQKHERVVLLLAEGNHDVSSSVWLRAMFQALYENEPRIEVIDSELPYYTYQHGHTMLAWHHGHLAKNEQLPILFAAQFPKVWGNTERRYCHTGHRHHTEEKEHSGMTVIQHPTLAARDAYAARGGWIADRQVTSITYSDRFGQVARNTVTPEMLV